MRTIDQITNDLLTDTHPGLDGCSNTDRVNYICNVLDCDPIDLNQTFDFAPSLQCKDPERVEAAKQVATLQLDYVRRLYENGHIDKGDHMGRAAFLILDIQRINWHLRHLHAGQETPPFPFIH